MNNKTWRAALYIRLSREDYDAKNNIKEASDSVTAQRRILSDFVDEKADITAVDYYIDDGVSGSTSDRPEFNRMIADIERG
jgi:DNA invertase Pin-like site-specific DNA recombinase